jgi:N-methylhydantoinase B
VRYYRLRTDSGGAGRFRGGLGAEAEVMAMARINCQTRSDRVHNLPWGLDGGASAMGNRVGVRKKDGTLVMHETGKVNIRLEQGEAYVLHSGGGGGFGPPLKRDRQAVLRDLRLGYISEDAAREHYGLALDGQGQARPAKKRS